MTPAQETLFRQKGYLFLKGAIPKNQLTPVKERVLDKLKRLKIWSSGKTLSPSIKKIPPFQQITKLSGSIKEDDLCSKVNKQLVAAITSLSEKDLVPSPSQLLISLPNQGDWTINGLNWHTDISSSARRHLPGIQVFVLIDDVQPHGGATLALAGSHLLSDRETSRRELREILRESSDLDRDLGSMNLSIVEMSGQAGDVYLMDMRALHTPSLNSTKRLRIMATVRYLPAVQ